MVLRSAFPPGSTTEVPATTAPGWTLGTPGGGLADSLASHSGWAVNANADVARIGRDGELRTAELLDAWRAVPGGPSVLHDLAMPLPGVRANIDHIVVGGSTVLIIDSKVWRAGWYWTTPPSWPAIGGHSFRGLHRFRLLDKQTLAMAHRSVSALLARWSDTAHATVLRPAVAVWGSSGHRSPHVGLLRSSDASVVPAPGLSRWRHVMNQPADRAILAALSALVLDQRRSGHG